jgi:ribonucleoside-diphosphate reductase alpha chain
MEISKNAEIVLSKRYLIRDADGKPTETIDELFDRVAGAIAKPDSAYTGEKDAKKSKDTFRDMMTSLEFLPNSPTLMNAGRPLGQLSACFVLPVADTMEDIFEAIKQAALIHKSGGGTGFSFSRLRSNGSTVNSTGGVASGPISFMRVFNMATEAVKQGGTRRGANMGILRVDHPDILEFIDCKKNNADITNFNISVGVTEAFMKAVVDGKDYELIEPSTKKAVRTLPAREVFDRIVDAAWHNGEPGIIFLDRLNRDNVVPTLGEIESTNPCGEQPLLPYESCNLGSINLSKMLKKSAGRL